MLHYGISAFAAGGYRLLDNIRYKTEPSLMFATRKIKDEIRIVQDIRPEISSKMKGYSVPEKAGMMALQTLVGFSRYKENFKYSDDYEIGENGEKIYNNKISTVTHAINIKTLQALEKLGYIKIDSVEEKFKQSFLDKVTGKEPKEVETLLIIEKLGFGNFEDIRKIADARFKSIKGTITRDEAEKEEAKKTIGSMKKKFSKVSFRLTDKPINFEELCLKSAQPDELSKEERTALKRLSIVFDKNAGILTTKNIDICKDRYGRDIIKYDAEEPFGKRLLRQFNRKKQDERNMKQELKVTPENLIDNNKTKDNSMQIESEIEH